MRPWRFWWQLWRSRWVWRDYDDSRPYGATGNQLEADWWEYGRKSGWW